MESTVHMLSRCRDWKVFATLTWSEVQPPTSAGQRKLLFGHLYRIARIARIPFCRLLWVVRQERGEKFNRPHYHALIGWRGKPATIGLCFALNSSWAKQHPLCGYSRHYVYDCGQDAASYITKGLSGSGRDTASASNYEAGKFGWSENEVTVSGALMRLVGRDIRRCTNGNTLTGHSEKSIVESPAQKLTVSSRQPDSILSRSGNWARREWPIGRDARHRGARSAHKNAAK